MSTSVWNGRKHPQTGVVLTEESRCRFAALIDAIRLIQERADERGLRIWDHTSNGGNPPDCIKFDAGALIAYVQKVGDRVINANNGRICT